MFNLSEGLEKSNIKKYAKVDWKNLKNIMLSERSQSQKTTLLHDLIYVKCLEKANPEDRKQMNGFQSLGAGRATSDC